MKEQQVEIDMNLTWTQTLMRLGILQAGLCLVLAIIFKSAFLALLGFAIFMIKRDTWKANAVALIVFLCLIFAAKLAIIACGVLVGYFIFRFR